VIGTTAATEPRLAIGRLCPGCLRQSVRQRTQGLRAGKDAVLNPREIGPIVPPWIPMASFRCSLLWLLRTVGH
jgi:hypothetical protein